MSSNGVNIVDETDITECDGEKVVTMMDVLQEQQEFEEDANAVLGASDDKECTYAKGYIKRQAIYACLTCCSGAKDDPTQRAGICLACSLICHENHELIELYTKRNFRCDCGNPKFHSHPCQFTPNKTELNEDNNYNQNFSGIYCICNRPYPDPESTVEEEMIQCIICEDWLHSNHLEAVVPANDLYAEMICKACMDKHEFLHDYSQFAVNYEEDVNVTSINGGDNPKKGDDTERTHLINGETNTSDETNVKMETQNIETELEENCSIIKNDTITEGDKKNDEETKYSIDCTAKKAEMLQLHENNSIKPMDTEENTKLDELGSQDRKDMKNNELQPNLNTSELTSSQIDTNDGEEKVNNDYKDIAEPSPKQREESITEQALKSTEDSFEIDHAKTLEHNTTNVNTEPSEISKPEEAEEAEHQCIESSDMYEEKNKLIPDNPSEPTDNSSNKVLDTMDTTVSPKETNGEVDSLEAATKELSDLIDNEQQNSSGLAVDLNADQTTTLESTVKEKGLRDEATNGDILTNSVENVNIPESTNNDYKRKLKETNEEVSVKKQKIDRNDICKRPRGVKRTIKGAAFWPSNYRQILCTCNECQSMYKDLSVLFLIDPEDTVIAYETLGKERINGEPATQYEKGLQALSSLDRVQQINALTEYNRMRDKLLDFLKSFKDRKEVVKEEDIKAFFAGMKPRREPDGVYFCR